MKKEKVPKSQIWAQRDTVDRDPLFYGRRHAGRVGGSFKHYGLASTYSDLTADDFLQGCGTYCDGQGKHAALYCVVTHEVVGYLPITEAMAYSIAGRRVGVTLEVIYDVM